MTAWGVIEMIDITEATTLKESWTFTPTTMNNGEPIKILIAGCGGTGARVLGPLIKIIPDDTTITLFDADVVEERNLARQNFMPEDVGRNKAELLEERFLLGNRVVAVTRMLDSSLLSQYLSPYRHIIVLGCTDSMEFRQMMGRITNDPKLNILWIDAGNERHTGQVVMEGYYPGFITDLVNADAVTRLEIPASLFDYSRALVTNLIKWQRATRPYSSALGSPPFRLHFTGMRHYFPELLDATAITDTPRCGERFDLQTVAVNQLAATWMICLLANLLGGKQSSTVGVSFSTSGMSVPLRMQRPTLSPGHNYISNINI